MTAAFFDVDETVLAAKSMFAFLRHWSGADSEQTYTELSALAAAGAPREDVNRAYYRRFAGVRLADLLTSGDAWYERYREGPTAFVAATVAALAEHRARGDAVVLVSGSFQPCLRRLADDVGAEAVLCTEPLVDGDGRLTGEVVQPLIGGAKAAAARKLMRARGWSPAACFAYGDHVSDLALLSAVGKPRVVDGDPELVAHAGREGWPILPATGGAAPRRSS